jgi:hypothetical protein
VKRLKIFNSIAVISLLVFAAMILTTLTDPASAERDPLDSQHSRVQSHLGPADLQHD